MRVISHLLFLIFNFFFLKWKPIKEEFLLFMRVKCFTQISIMEYA